jgi:hypothetical protein
MKIALVFYILLWWVFLNVKDLIIPIYKAFIKKYKLWKITD